MKNKKTHKKEQYSNINDQVNDRIQHRKKKNVKVKYKHKNHWLEEVDAYDFPNYKVEEE